MKIQAMESTLKEAVMEQLYGIQEERIYIHIQCVEKVAVH
jgi:hypothetical protein